MHLRHGVWLEWGDCRKESEEVRTEGCRQLAVVGLWAILTATFSSALIEKFLGAFKQR